MKALNVKFECSEVLLDMQVKFFASLGDIKNGKLLNRRSGERNGFMACTVLVSASRNRGYNVQLTLNNLYLCI